MKVNKHPNKNSKIIDFKLLAYIFIHLSTLYSTVVFASLATQGASSKIFYSHHEFSISSEKTNWTLSPSPIQNSNILAIFKSDYKGPLTPPLFTVRLDQLKKKQDLSSYIKEWEKDYPRFGFDILAMKRVNIQNQLGVLMDISNKQKRIRQIIFLKNKSAIILSCRGHKDNFDSTIKSCNKIFKNFKWI